MALRTFRAPHPECCVEVAFRLQKTRMTVLLGHGTPWFHTIFCSAAVGSVTSSNLLASGPLGAVITFVSITRDILVATRFLGSVVIATPASNISNTMDIMMYSLQSAENQFPVDQSAALCGLMSPDCPALPSAFPSVISLGLDKPVSPCALNSTSLPTTQAVLPCCLTPKLAHFSTLLMFFSSPIGTRTLNSLPTSVANLPMLHAAR